MASAFVALRCALAALWLGGCGAAIFRPERSSTHVTAPGAVATLDSLRMHPDGQARVISQWQAGEGVAVRSVQVVPLGERPCGNGAVSTAASVLRIGGEPRWQRPLPIAGVRELEVELPNAQLALQTGSVLDFDLHTPEGPTCARLSLGAEGTAGGWIPVTTAALGAGLSADQMGVVAVARPGLWAGAYRHGVEIGVGRSRGVEGRHAVLPSGRMLALGWMTERIWSLPVGFFGASLAIGYQGRVLLDAPTAGQPRLAHGPRLVVRPFTFIGVHPPRLPVGGRLGYLSLMELTFSFWLSGDGGERAGTLGVGMTWDRPLTR